MTHQPISLNFTFRPFGEDEITSTEELFIIDDNTLVFNQDIVHNARVDSICGTQVSVLLNQKDGITVTKKFDISSSTITEC